jgi:hypothetical protein
MTFGALLFSPPQAQVLRAEVVRRNAHEPADVAAAEPPSAARSICGTEGCR